MTEEDFLKRWSRRKRESAEVAKTAAEPAPPDVGIGAAQPRTGAATAKAEPPFDPATLPPIDSINAVSDITAFLREGVPAELTRAALRRVWTADPAIRDFVGLAENAWDFTDPNAMTGFGPLESSDEVRRMIAGIVDGIGEAARSSASDVAAESSETSRNSNTFDVEESADIGVSRHASVAFPADSSPDIPAQSSDDEVLLQGKKENLATQHDVTEISRDPKQISRRGHGGALPR